MTEGVIIALIGGTVTVIVAVIGVLVILIKGKLDKVEKTVDGRLTELLEITRKAHESIGKIAGDKEGRENLLKEQAVIADALATPVPDTTNKLTEIADNTKAISEHTKPKL